MPTPAPHCPINFLKGGGNATFSANCVKLLQDANFSPEDFGSYDQVSKRVENKRRRVNRIARGREAQAQATGGTAAPLPPSLQQHQGREVAHLGQNSCRQRQRGNPCSNLVDGHDDGLYPCVLVQGPALVDGAPNPNSEHGRLTQHEVDSATAGGRQREGGLVRDPISGEVGSGPPNPRRGGEDPHPSSRYPADQMARDERQRVDGLVADRQGSAPATGRTPDGAAAGAPSERAQQSVRDHQAALAKPPAERATMPPSQIDGETAAECIDTFKKMAEASMRQKCMDEVEKNDAAAGTARQRAALARERRRAAQRSARADRKLQEARNARRDAARALREQRSRAGLQSTNPKVRAAAEARVEAARAEFHRTDREVRRRQRIASRAEREAQTAAAQHSSARNAACRAEQGRRLREGQGRTDGRAPPQGASPTAAAAPATTGGAPPPPPTTTGATATPTADDAI